MIHVSTVGIYGHVRNPPATEDAPRSPTNPYERTKLEGEKELAYLIGPPIQSYPIIMAIPEDFEMHLKVFSGPHVLAPEISSVQPGDDLQGFLWLQGYLAL